MTTDLGNARRHEIPDSCPLNFASPGDPETDNRLTGKRMSRSKGPESSNLMRQIHFAFALDVGTPNTYWAS